MEAMGLLGSVQQSAAIPQGMSEDGLVFADQPTPLMLLTEWGGSSAPGLHLQDAFQIDGHTVCRYRNGLFL